ncbi:hypothetical protein D3C76_1517520 [compost metagenome]
MAARSAGAGRRYPADEAGPLQRDGDRHFLLGFAGAGGGRLPVRMAGPRARYLRRERHLRLVSHA